MGSEPYSNITRDTSYCRRCEQVQTLTVRHYRGKDSLKSRALNEISPSIPLPSEFMELMEEEAEEVGETKGMKDTINTS